MYSFICYTVICGPKGHGSDLSLPSRTAADFLSSIQDQILSPTTVGHAGAGAQQFVLFYIYYRATLYPYYTGLADCVCVVLSIILVRLSKAAVFYRYRYPCPIPVRQSPTQVWRLLSWSGLPFSSPFEPRELKRNEKTKERQRKYLQT